MPKKAPTVLLVLAWYLPDIHRGVARYAREHGWRLSADMAFDSELPWGRDADGIIALLGSEPDEVDFVHSMSCPIVDLTATRNEINLPRVHVDNVAVATMAVNHFRERGFKNYAYYGRYGLGTDKQRGTVYRDLLHEQNIDCHLLCRQDSCTVSDDSWELRRDWLGEKLMQLPKPLAMFASRDKDGSEVIDACVHRGINVPEEVAVLGVNNNELTCDFTPVPLSSIDIDWENTGYQGAALLDRLMQGASPPRDPILLPPRTLVVRNSSDILAVDNIDVAKALRFIWDHYTDAQLSVPQVCTAVHMSRSKLDKAFRKNLSRNIGEEIRMLRIRRVRELLLGTNNTLEDIAHAAGFATLPHFHRAFKEAESLTPRQYRLKHQSKKR